MRYHFYLALLTALFSCDQPADTQTKTVAQPVSRYSALLGRYKTISFTTLPVGPPSSDSLAGTLYKFTGVALDSSHVSLLPKTLLQQYPSERTYYASYKFAVDTHRLGLITRAPSYYEPNAIKLLLFDKRTDSITDYFELAQTFGDAGDSLEKRAWLFRNEANELNCFILVEESHNHRVADENDTTVEAATHYYWLDLSKAKVDTLKKSDGALRAKLKSLQGR